jgi:hypothetical protein
MPPLLDSSTDSRVWSREILDDQKVTDRCLRNWVTNGKFPPPDGNLNGRNFWLRATYERWKADVLAGRFSQRRRPGQSLQQSEPAAA